MANGKLHQLVCRVVPGTALERSCFLGLFGLAVLLRFVAYHRIDLQHDEISALVRLYPSLWETIRTGVMEQDTHPPGVQVFEWLWTALFGTRTWVVKLPFTVMGLASLWLLYRFAHRLAGAQVALVSLAFLATLQYTVMYHQLARPYAVGAFTIALLAERSLVFLDHGRLRDALWMGLAAVASAYAHHFAMLTAALIMLTCLTMGNGQQRRRLLAVSAGCILLYLPNLPILLHQLQAGGLQGWLAAPGSSWLLDHGWWLAHCSVPFAALWLALLGLALYLGGRHGDRVRRSWWIAGVWGAGPLLIGLAYSVWRAPVIQYSVLLFSFPFLLVPAMAGLRYLPTRYLTPLLVLVATVSTSTLVFVRQHQAAFYPSKYSAIMQGVADAAQLPERLVLIDMQPEAAAYLAARMGLDTARPYWTNLQDLPPFALASVLDTTTASSVFYGTSTIGVPEHVAMLQQRFPFLQARHDRVEGQTFLFSAMPPAAVPDDIRQRSRTAPMALNGTGWQPSELPIVGGTYPAPAVWDLSGSEFGLLFEAPVASLADGRNDILEGILSVSGGPLRLVMELRSADSTLFYRYAEAMGTPPQRYAVCSVKLPDLRPPVGALLRAYVWNPERGPATIHWAELRTRAGNPWLYGLYAPLLGEREYP